MAARRHIRKRVNFVATANAQSAAPVEKKRNVGAQAGRNFEKARSGHFFSRKAKKREKRGSGIARSSAEAAPDGSALDQIGAHAVRNTDFPGQLFESAVDKIIFPRLARELRISGDAQLNARRPLCFQN
jgi:hypothetical protein